MSRRRQLGPSPRPTVPGLPRGSPRQQRLASVNSGQRGSTDLDPVTWANLLVGAQMSSALGRIRSCAHGSGAWCLVGTFDQVVGRVEPAEVALPPPSPRHAVKPGCSGSPPASRTDSLQESQHGADHGDLASRALVGGSRNGARRLSGDHRVHPQLASRARARRRGSPHPSGAARDRPGRP